MKKISGKIIKGSGDGRKMGFPTINIKLDNDFKAEHGVYACWVEINGNKFKGAAHYGPRLIFEETSPKLEIHILEFSQDIYGEYASIELVEMIRSTKNFKSIENLVSQIDTDVTLIKKILS